MFVLYLDDAGFVVSRSDKHFVLAGIAIADNEINSLRSSLDRLIEAQGHPSPDALEIHASAIFNGRGWWRKTSRSQRRELIAQGLRTPLELTSGQYCLFGVVVDKEAIFPEHPVEFAFGLIVNRFNRYLRQHRGDPQFGMIIMDDSEYEPRLQSLAGVLRKSDLQSELMAGLVEVPFFVDSRATRGIQYADLVAYALWRKYKRGDSDFFDVISNWFDSEGGVVHGLHHYRNRDEPCDCPACLSRH